ncbi:hypothetical protein FI667_g3117, partial [Globisporangium splendens]
MKLSTTIAMVATAAMLLAASTPTQANVLRTGATNTDMTIVSRHLDAMEYQAMMADTPPTCAYEDGYDYVGNDLKNVAGQAADCCEACRLTRSCRAYSWSDLNGGTCWLKTGRGAVVSNANVKSAVVLYPGDTAGTCVNLENKTDYVGYDIGNAKALKPQDCCAECSKVAGCHAFTHTDYNGGTCWLKSQKGRMVYNEKATSSVNYGVTQIDSCGLEAGVDYVGNDIGSEKSPAADGCCNLCRDFKGCRAFSWTNQDGGTCYFKNRKDQTVLKSGVTSAAVFPNPPAPSCAMELGVDYVGNDIGNAPAADAYDCCSICMKKDGCKAFSWNNVNGGTCWLKSGKGTTVANANVKSSVV